MARTKQQPKDRCHWTRTDDDRDVWESDCGLLWQMTTEDGPTAHGMHYCARCGKPLKERRSQRQEAR